MLVSDKLDKANLGSLQTWQQQFEWIVNEFVFASKNLTY